MAPQATVKFSELPATFVVKGGSWVKKRSFEVFFNITRDLISAGIPLENSFNALPLSEEEVGDRQGMKPRYVKVGHPWVNKPNKNRATSIKAPFTSGTKPVVGVPHKPTIKVIKTCSEVVKPVTRPISKTKKSKRRGRKNGSKRGGVARRLAHSNALELANKTL